MSEYKEMAEKFLEESGTEINIKYVGIVDGFPNSDDVLPHKKYMVTLARNNESYKFPFYDSYRAYTQGTKPEAYDVLACLQAYQPEENMWDFAKEYGYTIDNEITYQRVRKIWHNCWKEYRSLKKLYDPEWMDRLAAIA